MHRKILLIILTILAAVAPGTYALDNHGSWALYPTVADYFSDVIETPSKSISCRGPL